MDLAFKNCEGGVLEEGSRPGVENCGEGCVTSGESFHESRDGALLKTGWEENQSGQDPITEGMDFPIITHHRCDSTRQPTVAGNLGAGTEDWAS